MAVSRAPAMIAMLCACAGVSAADGTDAPIAYLAVTDGYWEVWTARADGSHPRQVTNSKYDKARVSWFSDGQTLLVSANDGLVRKVTLNGVESVIPLEQAPVVDAAVSPDSKSIAFSFSTAIDGNDLWIARVDGGGAERVVRMAGLQHEPAWSPNGKSIYFLSGEGGQAHDIWRMNVNDRGTEQITVGRLYHFDVAVAVNGDIVYSNNQSGNYELYLRKAGANESEALTDDPALDARPAFSPDATQVLFESTRSGAVNLWRIDLKTKALTQVTHSKEGARAPAWYEASHR